MRYPYDPKHWTMFYFDGCPYCKKALRLLESEIGSGYMVDVHNNNVPSDSWEADVVEGVLGRRLTVPQIYIDGEYVGGYGDLCRLLGVSPR